MAYRTNGSSALSGDYRDSERPNLRVVDSDNPAQKTTDNIIDLDKKRKQRDAAKNSLRDSEQNAADNSNAGATDDDATNQARAAEAGDDTGFVNNVSNRDNDEKGKTKKGFGLLKGKSSIIAIIITLFGGGGLLLGAQSMLPFSLLEQIRTKFDTVSTVNSYRADKLLIRQLRQDGIKSPIAQKFWGGKTVYQVSNKQKQKLSAQGIDVEEMDINGEKVTVMLFDDGSGGRKVVAADTDTAAKIKNYFDGLSGDRIEYHTGGQAIEIKDFEINGKTVPIDLGDVNDFNTKYKTNSDFRNGTIKSSRGWRGAINNWFDTIAADFLSKNKITRNAFKDFRKRVEEQNNGNTRSMADQILDEDVYGRTGTRSDDVADSPSDKKNGTKIYYDEDDGHYYEVETDEDGNITKNKGIINPDDQRWKAEIENNSDKISNRSNTRGRITGLKNSAEVRAYLDDLSNTAVGKANRASSIANSAANLACVAFTTVGTIAMVVAAEETIQAVQISKLVNEAWDKGRAGDGADAPMNEMANKFTEPSDTVVQGEVVRENVSAMQSEGVSTLYSGQKMNPNDPSLQNLIIAAGGNLSSALSAFGISVGAFVGCGIAKLTASIVGAITDIGKIAICAASFGIACVVEAAATIGSSVATNIAVATVIGGIINAVIPYATSVLTRDLISNIGGEDLGNLWRKGSADYISGMYRAGGQSLVDKITYAAFKAKKKESDDEYARYQRETRSPFDISSKYTFMGSLVNQLITLSTLSNAPTGVVSTMGNLVQNSIVALLPSAVALDVESDLVDNYETVCPHLASIGAVGDVFCTPYIATDISTLDYDPDEVIETVVNYGGLNDDGTIKKDSNLAKYITYCSNRSSIFGVADSNIASAFATFDVKSGYSVVDTVANGTLGAIPVVGDIIDTVSNAGQLANMGWISGSSCVANSTINTGEYGIKIKNSETSETKIENQNSDWNELKYYQRFIEDDRQRESIIDGYESVVSLYLKEYYKENPLDDSYEGILARYSGLPKETVIAVLDYVEYWDYIANYDASSRKDFTAPEIEEPDTIYIDGDREAPTEFLGLNTIVYADLRTRAGITA